MHPSRALVAAALLVAGNASAQSSAEVNAGLQFNLINPGAYSLGMGGAFIGGADDATAAYANPAGLVNIARPEVSFEMRSWTSDHEAPFRGHGLGPKSGRNTDTIDGIETRTFRDTGRGLAYAAIVYPSERWAASAYQHELAHHDSSPVHNGIFYNDEHGQLRRLPPSKSALRLRLVSRGTAFAWRATNTLSVGFDVSLAEIELDSRTDRVDDARGGDPDFSQPPFVSILQRSRGRRFRSAAGVIWDVHPKIRLGAVYRREPSFPVDVTVASIKTSQCAARFHVPDVAGAGVSFRPTPYVAFNADYQRVFYSELTRDFVTVDFNDCHAESRAQNFRIADGGEYHAGIRYVAMRANEFLQRHPIVFTAGHWREAPHALRHTNPNDSASLLFQGARADQHYSAGLGILVTDNLQLSAGADISRRQRVVSISTLSRW